MKRVGGYEMLKEASTEMTLYKDMKKVWTAAMWVCGRRTFQAESTTVNRKDA